MSRLAPVLLEHINSALDGFVRMKLKSGFWFHRTQSTLHNFIVVQHSTKYKCFEIDVASGVFFPWDRTYGIHQLRRATGLPNVRENCGSLRMEDVPYPYNDDPREVMERISCELRQYASPWFDRHLQDMSTDPLVLLGVDLILVENPSTGLGELKQLLRKQADLVGATRWQRRETGILAMDLLKWRDELKSRTREG